MKSEDPFQLPHIGYADRICPVLFRELDNHRSVIAFRVSRHVVTHILRSSCAFLSAKRSLSQTMYFDVISTRVANNGVIWRQQELSDWRDVSISGYR